MTSEGVIYMANLFSNVPQGDLFGIKPKGDFNYQQAAKFLGMNKRAVAKAAGISETSVRYDSRMPTDLKEFFLEIISVVSIVSTQFNQEKEKTRLWFSMPNPLLGGVTPLQMILLGKHKKLMKFIQRAISGEMP
jgi:hypothetical protein